MKSITSALAKLTFVLACLFSIPSTYAQGLLFDPGSINFTNTTAGSVSTEQAVSVTFIQSPPFAMSLNVTSMIPPANLAFAVTNNTCATGSYAPDVPCQIKFTFTPPTAAGTVHDVFRFVTTELGNLDISLNGNSAGAPPPAPQAIIFTSTAPSNATVGGATYDVTATGGGSNNPVTFSIDSSADGICSISGNTVSFTAPGSCMVLANQAGNAEFEPAAQASQSFAIAAAPITPPATASTPVPSLSQWSLALLASMLGGLAFWRQRRKS